jgi:choline dehydrogenase
MRFDVVVVGSGSAGGVLAARVSEDPQRRVLLLEAGPDSPVFRPPAMLWELACECGFLPRGKMLGGCSAMNAAIALRGFEHDYDSWPQGWSWEQVLPYFIKSEADADYGGEPWHAGRLLVNGIIASDRARGSSH